MATREQDRQPQLKQKAAENRRLQTQKVQLLSSLEAIEKGLQLRSSNEAEVRETQELALIEEEAIERLRNSDPISSTLTRNLSLLDRLSEIIKNGLSNKENNHNILSSPPIPEIANIHTYDGVVSGLKLFEVAIDRLDHVADEPDRLSQTSTATVAAIEAQGNRIDRLNAENRAMLDDLQNGIW